MKKIAAILFISVLTFFCLPEIIKAACPLPAIGDISFSTSDTCSISSTIGADKSSGETSTINTAVVTLPSSTSITINNGGALALGSIVLNGGSITIQAGGVINVGNPLYVADADTDGILDSSTYYTATASGRRRLGLMKSLSADCDSANANTGTHLATGGTVTYDSATKEYIHKFTSSGTFQITCGGDISAKVLVVAGGGGGGYHASYTTSAGGGGAGGLIYNGSFSFASGSYTVTVGNGGARNVNGGNSSVSTITATGGGHGGSRSGQTIYAQVGGSGGGGADCCTAETYGAAGIAGQGYAGSAGTSGIRGGGGGAGADSTRPNGGAGATYNITGTSICYAGGGAGVGGTATCGGGSSGYNGTANTGGGGAGTMAGGSGIVVIRYSTL